MKICRFQVTDCKALWKAPLRRRKNDSSREDTELKLFFKLPQKTKDDYVCECEKSDDDYWVMSAKRMDE